MNEIRITETLTIPCSEVEIIPIRAQGSGGQNVNKVSNAVHLRFDIRKSSLPDNYKIRLLNMRDQRLSGDGMIVIKAQEFRSLEKEPGGGLRATGGDDPGGRSGQEKTPAHPAKRSGQTTQGREQGQAGKNQIPAQKTQLKAK